MTLTEMTALLTYMSVIDNRSNTDDAAAAWHQVIGDLPLEDCKAAVDAFRRESADWIQPAHIARGVEALQKRRMNDALGLTGSLHLTAADEDAPDLGRSARKRIIAGARAGTLNRRAYQAYLDSNLSFAEFAQSWPSRQVTSR
ncbi:hypothetical protein [Brevibacterium moorei]|uniref:hypothetical protein n=1 Tax=Brevibacterium moorei TaxID=2968457 RepID=UPI00211CD1FE|nr:hypothetical protein [Brevibacterium sp. 68QC2CO]MCQ9384388.1 hypothetical protein [Brevibacterium sp. 68QC2CO]